MKVSTPLIVALVAAVAVITTSCGKKPSADGALDEAVKALDQPGLGQQPPSGGPPAAPSAVVVLPATAPVSQQMTQAVASYKNGQYVDAVARLQWLRARKGNTPEQIIALQQAMAQVMGEIYARAARGDAKAQQAVKEYERLQTTQ